MDIVVDTNVVISGLLFAGVPGKIVTLWQQKIIKPYISKNILNEYIRVLAYPKFQLTNKEIEYLIYQEILPYFEVITPFPDVQSLSNDPGDDKFIHCALAQSINTIVSGDSDLLDLQYFKSIRILIATEFLQTLEPEIKID